MDDVIDGSVEGDRIGHILLEIDEIFAPAIRRKSLFRFGFVAHQSEHGCRTAERRFIRIKQGLDHIGRQKPVRARDEHARTAKRFPIDIGVGEAGAQIFFNHRMTWHACAPF